MANGTVKVSQVDVLTTSGTGTISIVPPATNTNRTLTLPDQTATVATLTTPSFGTTIGVGGATASASGAGVSFPATQSASTDANTLDDYEEGTWTPSVGGTGTYSNREGTYTKIGNTVFVQCYLQINSIGTGSTTTISGLPFVSKNVSGRFAGSVSYFNSLAVNAINLLVWNGSNTSTIQFSTVTASGANLSADQAAILGNSAFVVFSIIYLV